MRLEAVTVCIDYADFLAETLPHNRTLFDDLVVVTTPEDKETQRICRYWGVRHIQTDLVRSRWGEFHKAKGINAGLRALKLDGWALHLDADVMLPPQSRTLIERADLDKTFLYGADRYIVPNEDAWRRHQAMPPLQQDNYRVHLDIFRLAPRFAGQRMGGYAPPGYFQLWNPRFSNVRDYPEEHTSAAKTDVLFASKWWRNKRALLPEFVVYHLESEAAAQGANWDGRVTSRFGPWPDEHDHHHPRHHRPPPVHHQPDPPKPDPEHHRHHHCWHWPWHRHHHHGHHGYPPDPDPFENLR